MEYRITSKSEEETIELAENLESEKFPNMVICLEGDLGSGKTVFAKGFALAFGIDEVITSPTFTLIKEYVNGELPLYHMDFYRLDKSPEEIGLEEYYTKNGVVIIEWADIVKDYLPEERLDIRIVSLDEDTRIFVINPHGQKYIDLCEGVL